MGDEEVEQMDVTKIGRKGTLASADDGKKQKGKKDSLYKDKHKGRVSSLYEDDCEQERTFNCSHDYSQHVCVGRRCVA